MCVSAAVYESAIKKKPAGDKGAAEKAVAAAAAGKGKAGSSGKGAAAAAAAGGPAPAKAKKKPLNKKPLDESKVGPATCCSLL